MTRKKYLTILGHGYATKHPKTSRNQIKTTLILILPREGLVARWIALGMVSITIRVGYIGHRVGHRVGHNIEKVSDRIGKVSGSIDKMSAIWEDSMRVRLECRRIKCFEGARCEIVRKTDVLQKKRERKRVYR
jgi:hypothetical protein